MAGDERPDPDGASRRPAGNTAMYTVLVGIAFFAVIVIALVFQPFGIEEGGVLGTEPVEGEPLAQFAVPDVRGDLDGDGNVAQDDCETGENPCPPDRRRTPACEIELEDRIPAARLGRQEREVEHPHGHPSGERRGNPAERAQRPVAVVMPAVVHRRTPEPLVRVVLDEQRCVGL